MEKILDYYNEISDDKKKYIFIGIFAFALILINAISDYGSEQELVIIESTKEDFKNGDIVSDRTNEYYKNKDNAILSKYEELKNSNSLLIEKLSSMEKKFNEFEKESIKPEKEVDLRLLAQNGEPDLKK